MNKLSVIHDEIIYSEITYFKSNDFSIKSVSWACQHRQYTLSINIKLNEY